MEIKNKKQRIQSIETRNKISLTRKNRIASGKINVWNKGKTGIYSKSTIEKMRKAQTGKIRSNESKKKQSNSIKKWYSSHPRQTERYNRIGLKHKGKNISQEMRENISKKLKEFNKINPQFSKEIARKIRENAKANPNFGMKGKKHSKESIEKLRSYYEGKKLEQLYGIEKAIQIKRKMSDTRKRISKLGLGLKKHSKESIRKIKEARANQVFPIKDTSIEVRIQDFLTELKILHIPHLLITWIDKPYQCDIAIPKYNLIIECDGDYWHGNLNKYLDWRNLSIKQKVQKIKDYERTNELEESGWKVMRLWESDIKSMTPEQFKERLNPLMVVAHE